MYRNSPQIAANRQLDLDGDGNRLNCQLDLDGDGNRLARLLDRTVDIGGNTSV